MSDDTRFLQIVRGAIAAKSFLKKSLARKCKINRPYFSEMIHGDREMPYEVRQRLVKELNLKDVMERLGL